MELVNATRKAIDSGPGPADGAVREAVEVITVALSLFAPYTAEEMWERLGYPPSVATAGWRKPDPTLLVEDSVTAVVQVDGKVRDRLEVSPKIDSAALEQLARASDERARARSATARSRTSWCVRRGSSTSSPSRRSPPLGPVSPVARGAARLASVRG